MKAKANSLKCQLWAYKSVGHWTRVTMNVFPKPPPPPPTNPRSPGHFWLLARKWKIEKLYHFHLGEVITNGMAPQITGGSIAYLSVCSGADQRTYQSSASRAFAKGFHRWSVNSPHKGQVARKIILSIKYSIADDNNDKPSNISMHHKHVRWLNTRSFCFRFEIMRLFCTVAYTCIRWNGNTK